MTKRVLIAGGGIGGLSASLALAQAGFDVEVFEQAPEFSEIGAGIQITPNCARVLHRLGLEDALRGVASLPHGTEIRRWNSGAMLSRSTLGDDALRRFGFPYYHIHRTDLMGVLIDAARRETNVRLHPNTKVTGCRGSTLLLENGSVQGDVIVGADGIHSVVRASLFGAESPRYTGNVAWRSVVPAERLPAGLLRPVTALWMGRDQHFVHYYLRREELVNCVCVVENAAWRIESWTQKGEHDELKASFDGWHEGVRTLIDAMDPDACYKWALFDRDPMPCWTKGSTALLGDACHPTLPFMAQGAAMAIEDAAVLAQCLERIDDPAAAVESYAAIRQPRTMRVQLGSRRNARVFHMRPPWSWFRNRALKRGGELQMDWLYRYDVYA